MSNLIKAISRSIEEIFKESDSIKEYARGYFQYLSELLNQLDLNAIEAFAEHMEDARRNNNMVFFIGNGGSAATASHMVNDFGSDIMKKSNPDKPFRVLSLTDNPAVMLAIANDDGYDNLFVNQLRALYQQGDKLVAISASGNSRNVIAAAQWVKDRGGTVMSLVGFDGGKLVDISDEVIHVETVKGDYGPVEDIHIIMDHLIASWLQYKIQKGKAL